MYNDTLLILLEDLIKKYPDMRFSQILSNFGFVKMSERDANFMPTTWVDEYYLESKEVLKRVGETLKGYK